MTTSAQHPSVQGYGENAEQLAAQYESITFADVHRDTLHVIPSRPVRVLDIGAGSGRDAAALAAMGHQVLAVEPTLELRREGKRLHSDAGIEWLDDGLPELAQVLARSERFDLIFLTAVWMHLDEAERQVAMERLSRLVAPGGQIIMSLRHGPVPAGRRMFAVSCEETEELAQRHGLCATFRCERADMLGRADVRWTFLALGPAA
jgi:SAM-dependent methyltransferase